MTLPPLSTSHKWNHIVFVLCVQFFGIMSSRFMHVVAYVRISFLFKAEFIVCIYHILFVYLPVNRYLNCFHFLAIGNNASMTMGIQIPVQDLAFNSLGTYPEVKLLNRMITLCLILVFSLNQPYHFPQSLHYFILYPQSTSFQFYLLFCFLLNGNLNECEVVSNVLLICI